MLGRSGIDLSALPDAAFAAPGPLAPNPLI